MLNLFKCHKHKLGLLNFLQLPKLTKCSNARCEVLLNNVLT